MDAPADVMEVEAIVEEVLNEVAREVGAAIDVDAEHGIPRDRRAALRGQLRRKCAAVIPYLPGEAPMIPTPMRSFTNNPVEQSNVCAGSVAAALDDTATTEKNVRGPALRTLANRWVPICRCRTEPPA